MTTDVKDSTPDLPKADPKADRGDAAPVPVPVTVELTAAEVALITPKEAAKEPAKEEAKKADDAPKGEEKEAAKEPAKDDGEKPRDDKGKFIPKARFDEVNNRARAKVAALESKVAQLNERLAPLEGQDVKALEKLLDEKSEEYGALVADAKLDEAKAVMKEINVANRALARLEASAMTGEHARESSNVDALSELVGIYKEAYPVFDDGQKEVYNQEMVDFVARLQGGFELGGSSPAEALREAVEVAVAKFGLDPAPEPEAKAEEPPKPDLGKERKAAAVGKALKAVEASAPVIGKAGMDSDKSGMTKIDVGSLTYDQFNALPESSLARLRGDFA